MSGKERVYLLAGDDEYALGAAARQLVQELVPESERAFGLEVIEGRADNAEGAAAVIKRCLEAYVTRGFLLAQGKVIWWRDAAFLGDGQIVQAEAVKVLLKELVQVLKESASGGNVLLITTPKVDKRTALFKACQEGFVVREFAIPEKSSEAEKYGRATLQQALAAFKLKLSHPAMTLFAEKVGGDSRQIYCETEKLALYVHGKSTATEEDVDAIVSSSSESVLWDIQDAVGLRQLPRAMRVLDRLLAQKESPLGIVICVMNRLKELQVYREALDKGWLRLKPGYNRSYLGEWGELDPGVEEVLTALFKKSPRSLNAYRMGKLGEQAKANPAGVLRRNQRLAMAAHETLVSSSVPERLVLELMLMKMMV